MDNGRTVDNQTLLQAALNKLEASGLTVAIEGRDVPLRKTKADARVRIGYGGREVAYLVELKRGLRPASLGAVIHQVERFGEEGLLVTDHVTPSMAEQLRERRIQFIDVAGNAYLDQPPILIWIKGEKRAASGPQAHRAFQASGLRILFALICHPEWVALPYRELALRADVAHGTVGWVMAELPQLGFVAEMHGKRVLVQRERLLQQWAEFYPRVLRPRLPLGRYRAETLTWCETLDPSRYGAVLGGESAAARMTGYLRPGTATFYAQKVDPKLVLDLRLRADPEGNVEFLRKFWTFEAVESLLAPEPLVYADLMASGDGRCMETAKTIFDRLYRQGD